MGRSPPSGSTCGHSGQAPAASRACARVSVESASTYMSGDILVLANPRRLVRAPRSVCWPLSACATPAAGYFAPCVINPLLIRAVSVCLPAPICRPPYWCRHVHVGACSAGGLTAPVLRAVVCGLAGLRPTSVAIAPSMCCACTKLASVFASALRRIRLRARTQFRSVGGVFLIGVYPCKLGLRAPHPYRHSLRAPGRSVGIPRPSLRGLFY